MERNITEFEKLDLPRNETLRTVNPGAEKWLGVVVPVLDHGFLYLNDYLGDDKSIEQAARVSYGEGTRKTSQTRGLLRFLMRHSHTSPFEMVEFKIHAKMPIFVARQWVRHRTASLNEYSARYSVLRNEFYIPEPDVISVQSTDNKQGRGETVDAETANEVRVRLSDYYEKGNDLYHWLLGNDKDNSGLGIARELARAPLAVGTYTEWYWKIDLHNMLHFLKLRNDPHAQLEIRKYAEVMAEIVKDSVPITFEAFEDYQVNSVHVTRPEKDVLTSLLKKRNVSFTEEELLEEAKKLGLDNKRENEELVEKIKSLGLVAEEWK